MKNKLINILKNNSTYKPDNFQVIVNAVERNENINFFSWECPPRQIIDDKKFGRWVNFDVNIKKVVNGELLDEFTEIPRITLQPNMENWFVNEVLSKYKKARYIKIIADTNAKYLFTKSYKILGEQKMRSLSSKFKRLLEIKAKNVFSKNVPNFYLYTDFQKLFLNEYEMFYNFVFNSFNEMGSNLVDKDVFKAWYACMFEHVGYSKRDKKEKNDVLRKAIASYAAEGMVFELLNKTNILPNPVWINWEEEPNLSRASNILRKRYGLKDLPVIYFKNNVKK